MARQSAIGETERDQDGKTDISSETGETGKTDIPSKTDETERDTRDRRVE